MSEERPTPSSGVLGKDEILAHIAEVGDELAIRNLNGDLVVVGGSYMALCDLREATADVDSLTRLTDQFKAIVREVAGRHGLSINWLKRQGCPV